MRRLLIATLLTFSFNAQASTSITPEEYNPVNQVFSDPKLIETILMQKQSNSKSLILEFEDIYNCLNTSRTIRKAAWKAVAYVKFRFDLFSENILKTHSAIAIEIYKNHLTDKTPFYKNLVEAQPNIRQQIGSVGLTQDNTQLMVMCELMGDDSAIKMHIDNITAEYTSKLEHGTLHQKLDQLMHYGSKLAVEHKNWLIFHVRME
ncbi:MAG: hypothetical protein KBB83_03615 [Alphaproteobacteria bacterium]|nr:hypothetical protein [Alphaproteobacteria bacterium]